MLVLATGANAAAAVIAANAHIATQEAAGYFLIDAKPLDKTNYLLRFIRQP